MGRAVVAKIPKYWAEDYEIVINMCAETLVDDEAIVPDAENRPFYKDTLTKIFMRSLTIDAAKKEAKDDNVRKRLGKLIRESKKMLEKALGGAPDEVPSRTRKMVDSQEIDPDELWSSHSKSVFPNAARQPKKAMRFAKNAQINDGSGAGPSGLQTRTAVTAVNVPAAAIEVPAPEASDDVRVHALEDENRRLKALLETSENAKRDLQRRADDAEAMADGYRQRLEKHEQHKTAVNNSDGSNTDGIPSTSTNKRKRPVAVNDRVDENPAKRSAVEEHLRRKLQDVIGESKQDVSQVPHGSVPKIDYWMGVLKPEDCAELATWTSGDPYDRFTNKKKLGKGGQGTVYRVDFQQQYAVKEVTLTGAYKFKLLLREAKASYKLEHKNLLSCLFRYFDGKKAYLITQLMDRGDLEDILKQFKGSLPEEAAAYVIRELLSVLHFLHNDAKTAHRDVKPENILADSVGEIKLADFGLCGDLTEPRETGLGTPCFLSPEMVIAVMNGGNEHDLKVDTWAVGVTTYNLLTKLLPFKGPNKQAIYNKILREDPLEACRRAVQAAKTEISLSVECWAFLERCLVKDKSQRADTAELLASAFVKKASPDAWKVVVAPATEA